MQRVSAVSNDVGVRQSGQKCGVTVAVRFCAEVVRDNARALSKKVSYPCLLLFF